jgi:hypothetical protein
MSAWGIGATTATRRGFGVERAGADSATVQPAVPSIDTLVTWIPGEVIAAYAAIVLALQPEQTSGEPPPPLEVTSGWWLFGGVLLAGLVTWLGGWSKTQDLDAAARKELIARTVLAGGAFAIWSVVVPGSWWYSIDDIAENQAVAVILAGLLGATYALLAEGLVRRVGR